MSFACSDIHGSPVAYNPPGWFWTRVGHSLHAEVEAFIQRRFWSEYRARLHFFLPELVSLREQNEIAAAVGFGNAEGRALYLEQYLPDPVEQVLQRVTGAAAPRARIVEVGNLASGSPGGARQVILMLTRLFQTQGVEWVVFTAIPSLRNTFDRMGIALHELGEARPEQLQDGVSDWGSYYAARPRVMAGHVADGFQRLQQNPVLARMMERIPTLTISPEDAG